MEDEQRNVLDRESVAEEDKLASILIDDPTIKDSDSEDEAQETSTFLTDNEAASTPTAVEESAAEGQTEVHVCPPYLSFILYLAYFLGSASAMIAVLITDQDKQCDAALNLWTYVQLAILVVGLVLRVWTTCNRIKRPAPNAALCWSIQARAGEFLLKLLNMFWFVWFVIGMVWTFGSSNCKEKAPSLYVMSLTFIIINLFIIGSCVLCCLVVAICCGVVYIINPQAFGRRANQGASKTEIEKLELREYSEGVLEDEADAKCAICLSQYETGDKIRFLPCTPIKHHFHQACVDEWLVLNKNCPFCKRPVTQDAEKTEGNAEGTEGNSDGNSQGTQTSVGGSGRGGEPDIQISVEM